jgi:hypothetical protein
MEDMVSVAEELAVQARQASPLANIQLNGRGLTSDWVPVADVRRGKATEERLKHTPVSAICGPRMGAE